MDGLDLMIRMIRRRMKCGTTVSFLSGVNGETWYKFGRVGQGQGGTIKHAARLWMPHVTLSHFSTSR